MGSGYLPFGILFSHIANDSSAILGSSTIKLKCTQFKSTFYCCQASCNSRRKGTMSNFTVHGHRIFARWEPLKLGSLPHMRRRKLRIGGARTRDLCPHYSSPQSPAQSLPSPSKHSGFLSEGWRLGFFGRDSGRWNPCCNGRTALALSPFNSHVRGFQILSLVLRWALS